MDAKAENIEEYILGNFEKLPKDVLEALLASLDPTSLLNLCSSSKAFSNFCSSKIGKKFLDRKAVAYIAEQAPLAKPIRSLGEQVDLIKRGFKTCYYTNFWYGDYRKTNIHIDASAVKFGVSSDEDDMNFSIVGFPPAKGTKVWVYAEFDGDYDNDADRWRKIYPVGVVEVYPDYESLLLQGVVPHIYEGSIEKAEARIAKWNEDLEIPWDAAEKPVIAVKEVELP